MENEVKVFHSNISRTECNENSHLYELLKVTPAKPIPQGTHRKNDDTWEFIPNNDKHFKKSRISKSNVKTVKDLRALLEKDVYINLPDDIWRQEKFLLRKIQDGSSCDEKTKEVACKMLSGESPISRPAWQMLANINPGNHNYSKQFILWNGRCVQVNGSRGGKYKYLYNFDLNHYKNVGSLMPHRFKKNIMKSKMGLLRNSLNVKFKPGPLRKKMFLDNSHHKYQLGQIELVKLPAPALEIRPTYGTVIESPIAGFINSLSGETGTISKTLAEFAISVVGKISNHTPTQLDKECCVTLDLHYKYDQNRLLMRRNIIENTRTHVEHQNESNIMLTNGSQSTTTKVGPQSDSSITMVEINKIMNDILNSVEISLMQDSVYYSEEESTGTATSSSDCAEINSSTTKDKPKRKFGELGKLDVTVIKLPESCHTDCIKPCDKSFCTMGCVCESIDCLFTLKQHCGVLDCMFECKCEASKFRDIELLERDCSEILPGLMNLDNEINSHLSKEEKKFHQTVIVSGEKSILLKSQKRNSKLNKKYSEFFKNLNLNNDDKIKNNLVVHVTKLDCGNLEPFCMIHYLYKCFCKGKFTESYIANVSEINPIKTINNENSSLENGTIIADTNLSENKKGRLKARLRKTNEIFKSVSKSDGSESVNLCLDSDENDACNYSSARTEGHYARKYNEEYYKTTNKRISEMEENDRSIKKKLTILVNGGRPEQTQKLPQKRNSLNLSLDSEESNKSTKSFGKNEDSEYPSYNSMTNKKIVSVEHSDKTIGENDDSENPFSNTTTKISLKKWLETSYKMYKERRDQGILKNCLDAPKRGKMCLQTWEFILSRYRERKNHFFVSNLEPYRTFLAVDGSHPFFENCTNIDDIRFAELPKYPLVIRNLVTNSVDSENSFCMLVGRDHCWELIGSAVKVFEHTAETRIESKKSSEPGAFINQDDAWYDENRGWIDQISLNSKDSTISEGDKVCKPLEEDNNNSERSKWFVMTVENDFTEIQFYKKGFFVTYAGIQRSISLARISEKTVRLSSQARIDKNSAHQFGIYAIPSTNECCVFIGPYELNEPLGIEVIKTCVEPKTERKTRGVWITTNKVDNIKVIDNPLSFMPSVPICDNSMVTLQSTDNNDKPKQKIQTLTDTKKEDKTRNSKQDVSDKKISKIVKPIKIRRTNGFYHLSSKNILQQISPNKGSLPANNTNLVSLLKKPSKPLNFSVECGPTTSTSYSKPVAEIAPQCNNSEECITNSPIAYTRPVAEIAPQIKITSVYSESDKINASKGSAVLILKPEEINKNILANTAKNDNMSLDIEKFLETSTICIAPRDEVFLISDGEEDTITEKNVWIQCRNVSDFGCIRGRIRHDNFVSFELPGFNYSEYYTEQEAFNKINQVLGRKIYIPDNITLQWEVVETKCKKTKMLTPQNLAGTKYLMNILRKQRSNNKNAKIDTIKTVRTYSKVNPTDTHTVSEDLYLTTTNKAEIIESLEATSKQLENQSTLLWNEAVTRRDEIRTTLNAINNLNEGMSTTLKDIMSMNEPAVK